jgi:hypothetical protein
MDVDIPDNRILTPCEFVRWDLRKRPEDRFKLSYFSINSCGKMRLAVNMVSGFETFMPIIRT